MECNHCGLVYVGETKGRLNTRVCGHRSGVNNDVSQVVYQHFNRPDHSILSMKVRILQKIYHPTNNPNLSTPLRKQTEEYWIKELGTAIPYGCNDNIHSIGNLSSPKCSSLNVMSILNPSPRRKRSHGHRHYTSPDDHDISFNDLLSYMQKPLGLHHIRTKLFSLPLSKLSALNNTALARQVTDFNSTEYQLAAVVSDVASHRLFKPVRIHQNESNQRSFLKIEFANKGLDAINISNILHHKDVQSKVPPYFKNQSVPLISYSYTKPIATKIFNHKRVLRDLDSKDLKSKPLTVPVELPHSNMIRSATLSLETLI